MLVNWLYCLYGSLQWQGNQQFSCHNCDFAFRLTKLSKIETVSIPFSERFQVLAFYYIQFSRTPMLLNHSTVQCANINKPNCLFTHWFHYRAVYLITWSLSCGHEHAHISSPGGGSAAWVPLRSTWQGRVGATWRWLITSYCQDERLYNFLWYVVNFAMSLRARLSDEEGFLASKTITTA